MPDQLIVALRPWTYSEIGVLWGGLLALIAACLWLQAIHRPRLAYALMSGAGLVVTGRFGYALLTHYASCPGCSFWFDVCPNPSTWAFLYDYLCCCALLGLMAWQESRRFGSRNAWIWAVAAASFPIVVAPLVFHRVSGWESDRTTLPRPRLSWIYAAIGVLAAPFVMPALPFDHFGSLGGEFFWDSTSNAANTYSADAVMLLFGQVFLFTLPRTKGLGWQVAGLFLAFNNLAAYIAVFLFFFDRRTERHLAWGGRAAAAQIAAVFLGNAVAAGFGVTLRYTEFVIKPPLQACREGEATRDAQLPLCASDLADLLPRRERDRSRNLWAAALPAETKEAISLAHRAMVADEATRRDLVSVLATHHGARIPSCEEAGSANYAVVNECPAVVTTGTAPP